MIDMVTDRANWCLQVSS